MRDLLRQSLGETIEVDGGLTRMLHGPGHAPAARCTSGSATTNGAGEAQFCYTGPALPGSDAITAYADTNNNGVQDPGEPTSTSPAG